MNNIHHDVVETPPLHKNQKTIWNAYFSGKYRNFVVNAGRRFGKSKGCLSIAIECAVNRGQKVWWVAPTYRLLGNQWRAAKDVLGDVYTAKSEVDKRMEFYYERDGVKLKGELNFRSADKPDNLRGDGIDLLIIDEAAFQSLEVYKVLRPATVDTKGNIIFISTPNGHNWFYTFFQRGLLENRAKFPRWWSKHYTSYDNPLLDPQELEDAKGDLTETEFRVEHMAEFIDDIGKVFSNVHANAQNPFQESPQMGDTYSIGIDLARKHDATVLSIVCVETSKEVYGLRLLGEDWELQKKKLAKVIQLWRPKYVYADATAVGQPVVEDLQKLVPDYMITPFILSPQSKPPLIQALAVKFQNKEIQILDEATRFGKIQINELLAYEVKQSKNGLNWQYSAPKGGKDDTVIALALASQPIMGKKSTLKVVENPFFKSNVNIKAKKKADKMSVYARKSYELKYALLKSKGLI